MLAEDKGDSRREVGAPLEKKERGFLFCVPLFNFSRYCPILWRRREMVGLRSGQNSWLPPPPFSPGVTMTATSDSERKKGRKGRETGVENNKTLYYGHRISQKKNRKEREVVLKPNLKQANQLKSAKMYHHLYTPTPFGLLFYW